MAPYAAVVAQRVARGGLSWVDCPPRAGHPLDDVLCGNRGRGGSRSTRSSTVRDGFTAVR
jgi:hypothetical protein